MARMCVRDEAYAVRSTGYIAIIRLVDVTDDTVTVQKTLLQELAPAAPLEVQYTASGEQLPMSAPPLATVCAHKEGSKLLLLLLAPKQTRCALYMAR
jgi:hypothetical protein